MPPRAFVSWSSGKDSAYALFEARRLGLAEIAGVLTTINEVYDRVAMHGVRSELLDRQIAALGLPAIKVPIPSPCPNEIYEARAWKKLVRASKPKAYATSCSAIFSSKTFVPTASKNCPPWGWSRSFRCGNAIPPASRAT